MKSLGWRFLLRVSSGILGFWISGWSAYGEAFTPPDSVREEEAPPQVAIEYKEPEYKEPQAAEDGDGDRLPPADSGEIAIAPPTERELPVGEEADEFGGLPSNREATGSNSEEDPGVLL